jgi:hypothetical protein
MVAATTGPTPGMVWEPPELGREGPVRELLGQRALQRSPCSGGAQLRPSNLGAETPAEAPQPRAAQEPFDRVHLGGLEADDMPAAGQRLTHPGDGAWRHLHDGPIDVTSQAVAELERIPPVALLRRPVRLEPQLVGIHHDRRASQARQFPRHEERHRPALQRDRVAAGRCWASCQRRNPSGVVGNSACARTCPRSSWITNTLALASRPAVFAAEDVGCAGESAPVRIADVTAAEDVRPRLDLAAVGQAVGHPAEDVRRRLGAVGAHERRTRLRQILRERGRVSTGPMRATVCVTRRHRSSTSIERMTRAT